MPKLTIPADERLGSDLIASDMDLIEQLVEYRRLKGMTQKHVADAMGVDRSVVSKFESLSNLGSKNHTMRTARAYAEAIGVFVAHIVVDAASPGARELASMVERHVEELGRANDLHEQKENELQLGAMESSFS